VTAETLYEAAALALSLLRREDWTDAISPGTPIEVEVREPPTTHAVSLLQIQRGATGSRSVPTRS
jgi:hypothetical protein